jgi:hypothetical protein
MSDINDFKDLMIWQKGMDIAEKCYFLTKLFPKDELYPMVQQIRRSAVSIPANIALTALPGVMRYISISEAICF